ncbi:hypothetical protein LIER_23460 [Lithospermum erythrorhizon]|uniref:Late embryogenesis abundant protein LEA-2 subgroup domain-containing protein n=1 Tax=Lithospermum erythrorhizon TaxID=34254 RepID=A0AAV3QYX2_LITER
MKTKGSPGYAHPFQQPVFQPEHNPHFHEDYQSYNNQYGQNRMANPIITNGGYYGPLDSHENERKSPFGQILLIVSIFVLLALCFASLVIWMLFGINLPEFQVSSLAVTDFSTASTTIVGKWDVNISIANPNDNFRAHFDHLITSIYFKDSLLAETSVPDINLFSEQNTTIHSIMATEASGAELEKTIVAEMEEERKTKKSVTFSVRLDGKSALTTKSTSKSANIKVYCDGLTVGFSDDGFGNMTEPAVECLLYPS